MFLLDFDEKPREALTKFLDLNIYARKKYCNVAYFFPVDFTLQPPPR
jgi:hypothetical protein